MYSIKDADDAVTQQASIAIIIPPEIQGDATTPAVALSAQNVSVIARGRVLPSGNLSVGLEAAQATTATEVVIAGNIATINIDRIDMGATITLTYHLRGQDDAENDGAGDGEPDADSLIDVPAANDSDVSAFTIRTRVPTNAATPALSDATNATSITGGRIHPEEGSGTMTMTAPSDNQVEAGESIPTITLQYKAATAVMDVDMTVDVKGLVFVDDTDTAGVTEVLGGATYGVVSYRGNFSPTQSVGTDNDGAVAAQPDADGNDLVRITFAGLNFTAGSNVHNRHQKRDRPRCGWCCYIHHAS